MGTSAGAYFYFRPDESSQATPASPKKGEQMPSTCNCKSSSAINVPSFDSIAYEYDSKVYFEELSMGLPLLRRYLLSHARGNVCEMACGTGGNLRYYNFGEGKVGKVLMTDSSEKMLHSTAKKINDTAIIDPVNKGKVRLIAADIAKIRNSENVFPPNQFDTVVDTFGLCSYNDPKEALKTMLHLLKNDGELLMLEHGSSTYFIDVIKDYINGVLERGLDRHIAGWGGCVWNRKIELILHEAGISGDDFYISITKWHFGTTYYIRVKRKTTTDR